MKGYRKTVSSRARLLKLSVQPGADLEVHLDFQPTGLHGITVYIDHRSASFFQSNLDIAVRVRLDAAFNFILWLDGR